MKTLPVRVGRDSERCQLREVLGHRAANGDPSINLRLAEGGPGSSVAAKDAAGAGTMRTIVRRGGPGAVKGADLFQM